MAAPPPASDAHGTLPNLPTSLATTLGAVEIGVMLSAVLYGVTTLQTYIYWQTPNQDKRWLRYLVAIIWICETVHQAIVFVLIYDYTVTNYEKPLYLLKLPWSLSISVLLYGISGTAVQAFFGYRVFVLSQNAWLAIPAWLLSFARAGSIVSITVTSIQADQILAFGKQYSPLVATSLISSAAVDWWNMIFLCYYLAKRRPAFKQTAKIVNRMMLFSIETGLITSLVAISAISCISQVANIPYVSTQISGFYVQYYAMPLNHIWLGILMIYAKLFSNAFLVSLNIRTQAERGLVLNIIHSAGSQDSGIRPFMDVGAHVELAQLQRQPSGGLKVGMQHNTYVRMGPEDGVLNVKLDRHV